MNWMILSLCSSVLLGFYEIAKKAALRNNAVPPVLFLHVVTAAALWLPLLLLPHLDGAWTLPHWLTVDPIGWQEHAMLFAKAVLAGSSWILASYALKHLPMSIASPIRASSPIWTILIAVLFMHERPSPGQWLGVTVIVLSFYAFSVVGKTEGIHFHRDRWVLFMVAGTLLGACSALYDKYLFQTVKMRPSTVQAWFSIYLTIVILPLFVNWWMRHRSSAGFEWRWSIPTIAVLLLMSDFLYFMALDQPGAMVSLVSPLRRTSVVIAFVAGIRIYGERNWRPKAVCIASLLVGVYVLSLARG